MEKKERRRGTITIGTDPEFALIDSNGSIKSARSQPFFASSNATIGCDGAGTPVEIRPSPQKITETNLLIDEITLIFFRIAKWCKSRDYTILGGAMGGKNGSRLPIGSHIHFGGEEFLNKRKKGSGGDLFNQCSRLTSQVNSKKLSRCLDTYLIPIANFFISSQEIYKRRKTGYGGLGETRSQKWGIEYRTPYCFLLSPLLTAGIYSLASLIAYNYKKIPLNKNLYYEALLYYDNLDSPSRSRKIQKNIYKKIKPRLLDLMSHNSPNAKLNSKIISLFNLIEQNKMCKNRDVLANYNFNDLKIPPFTVHWGRGNDIGYIKNAINGKINNTTNGEIFIYGTADCWGGGDDKRLITLSKGLPKITYKRPLTVKIRTAEKSGFKYHIGLSGSIINDILRNYSNSSFLWKYLNKLVLREYNDV